MRLPIAVEDLARSIHGELPAGSALDRLRAAVDLAGQASSLGDGLVGHFVEAARSEGCSWAEIGAELGVSKQAAQQRFVARPTDPMTAQLRAIRLQGRHLSRRGFFSRFTAAAGEIITHAQEQARQLGHESVRSDHLLLSLLRDADARPARALVALGIDVGTASRRILEAVGRADDGSNDESPPFAPEAKKVLERALREGLRCEAREVEPEHLLLGALADADSVAAQVLADLGATPESVRRSLGEVA